jgi:hypothetical protein
MIYYNALGPRPRPEALIAPELAATREKQAQVLGARTSKKIQSWQTVLTKHPDYRDAYIQLAVLSYAQGDVAIAKSYLVQAAGLDPNGKVNELLKFVFTL